MPISALNTVLFEHCASYILFNLTQQELCRKRENQLRDCLQQRQGCGNIFLMDRRSQPKCQFWAAGTGEGKSKQPSLSFASVPASRLLSGVPTLSGELCLGVVGRNEVFLPQVVLASIRKQT